MYDRNNQGQSCRNLTADYLGLRTGFFVGVIQCKRSRLEGYVSVGPYPSQLINHVCGDTQLATQENYCNGRDAHTLYRSYVKTEMYTLSPVQELCKD